MLPIEECSLLSQKYNKDRSKEIFNKDHKHSFTDWNYGYCQGYADALEFSILLVSFNAKRENMNIDIMPIVQRALCGSQKEKENAIRELIELVKKETNNDYEENYV